MSPLCHVLIGMPACGKSTLAAEWQKRDPSVVIVSTDQVRQQIYGDEATLGHWPTIEAEVLKQAQGAIASGRSVIYEATNAHRAWRIQLLQKLASVGATQCIGWYCKTSLTDCQKRNRHRDRQVPPMVINVYADWLKRHPPTIAEGFLTVHPVPMKQRGQEIHWEDMTKRIQQGARSLVNQRNRWATYALHRYSGLVDCDRLLYLMSLLLHLPGAGLLHEQSPEQQRRSLSVVTKGEIGLALFDSTKTLDQLVSALADIDDSLSEFSLLMAKLFHPIYAQPDAIAEDLAWLEQNGLIGDQNLDQELQLEDYPGDRTTLNCHVYSDTDSFQTLILTIRHLLHYPCLPQEGKIMSQAMIEQLQPRVYTTAATFRKYVEHTLKPYKLLPEKPMKRGYYLGTAILSKNELSELYTVLQTQFATMSDDLITLRSCELLKERLMQLPVLPAEHVHDPYPVRIIGNRAIVATDNLPEENVARKLDQVTEAIQTGTALQFGLYPHRGQHEGASHIGSFWAYPLQLVFHNIGWYLGYECLDDEVSGLFRFERIDRLYINNINPELRGEQAQRKALKRLTTLREFSYGIFLGNDVENQKKYLATKTRKQVETQIELYCTDGIFQFIREGTRRFPTGKVKMTKQTTNAPRQSKRPELYSLPKNSDPNFPNRLQITLPSWCIDDIDFVRWVIGFQGQVKVVKPEALVEKIKKAGETICQTHC